MNKIMIDLIVLIITSISIVNIIQNEVIFSKSRVFISNRFKKLYGFIMCPTCFGFWIGLILSSTTNIHDNVFINIFFCGLISSIVNKTYVKLLPDEFGIE